MFILEILSQPLEDFMEGIYHHEIKVQEELNGGVI